jgi:hypothetical protein
MLSTGWLIGGGVAVFLLGVLVGVWRIWSVVPRFWPFGAGAGDRPTSVEEVFALPSRPKAELRSLAEAEDEIQGLYETIGFSPVLEQKVDRILQALRSSLTVEIPDYEAFREALDEARTEMSLLPDQDAFEDETAREDVQRAEALLEEVWQRRGAPEAVIEILEEAPVERQLPYIERVPVTRGGTVRWRSPVRISVLRKRPADTQQFRRRLDRLAALVKNASLPRADELENELRAAIGRLRRDIVEEDVYVPTLQHRLEEAAATWLNEAPRSGWKQRKNRLDDCLLDVRRLQEARPYLLGDDARVEESVRDLAEIRYQERTVSRIRSYVDTDWMHTPWLTDQLLGHLLSVEVLNASGASHRRLSVITQEVQTRTYDPQESMRRLRDFEEEHGLIQSLAFSLLRLRQEAQPDPVS